MQEVNEKDWLKGVRQTIAMQWQVPPAAVIFSPGKLRAVFVQGPPEPAPPPPAPAKKPARRPPPRRFKIVVVDNQAKKVAAFRPVTVRGGDEPPKDVKFLGEDQVIYEVVAAPPPAVEPSSPPSPTKSRAVARTKARKKKATTKAGPAASRVTAGKTAHVAPKSSPPAGAVAVGTDGSLSPPRLFIIQSLQAHARPVRCEGRFFAFTAERDHVAFVGGSSDAAFVAVDGAPVYPRRGRSVISSAVAWSKDGHSLAFIETPTAGPPRLVLLAEYDNATGDTTWDLPASTSIDGARVFWAGTGRLVVGKTIGHPLFSTSFQKQTSGAR
jgi:hypothetical protein